MIPSQTHNRTRYGFLLLTCLFLFANVFGQTKKDFHPYTFSPGGLLDHVSDNKGNIMQLGEICINDRVRSEYSGGEAMASVASCSSGYFQLFLETGSGMEGTSAVSMARLNVLCQVLQDISGLINSPCTTTGQKVNIWVKKSISGIGGAATPFFNVPYSTTASGIADNAVWLTVNSGVDAFASVAGPLVTMGGGASGSTFFHGSIVFNFTGAINWHTDLTTPPAAGEWDLYSVALHEMMHAMGFCSLVDYTGTSLLGASHKYFTRFDTHIKTPGGVSLITAPSASCGMYNWDINTTLAPVTSVLSPGGPSVCPLGYSAGSDHTVCSHKLEYVGSWPVNIPLYTPECFERGSSLSHFEDECYVPAGFPLGAAGPATNNQYFAMSNAGALGPYGATTIPGAMKRYPKPEERNVLCDIGYSVNTTYGNATNLNYINYGGSGCPGLQVVGGNDGIAPGGAFTYSTVSTTPININPAAARLLGNDYGVSGGSFKCLEVVFGSGSLSVTSGTLTSSVMFTPSLGSYGVQLLRYIPVSSSGVEGNITYVFVYVGGPGCTSSCDLVSNGSFENTVPGAVGDYLPGVKCWQFYGGSPDLLSRCAGVSLWCFPSATFGCESHPFSPVANDHYIGIISGKSASMGGYYTEAVQTQLTSALLNLQTYRVGFWAKILPSVGYAVSPAQVLFATGVGPMSSSTVPLSSVPTTLTPFVDFKISFPDSAWHYYTKDVTYSGPVANTLVFMGAPWLNPTTGVYSADYGHYMIFDDISIIPLADVCTFNLPDLVEYSCGTLIDLDSTVNIPGGTFTWQKDSSGYAVITHNVMFDPILAYNAAMAGMPAGDTSIVTVCYEYMPPSGCKKTVCKQIKVVVKGIWGPTEVCEGESITLTNAVAGGVWTSGDPLKATVGPTSGVVNGISAGIARISYVLAPGCYVVKKIVVKPTPVITPAAPLSVCVGSTVTISGSAGAAGYFAGGAPAASIGIYGDLTGVSLGTGTITYVTFPGGCATSMVVTVTTAPAPITPVPAVVCVGSAVSLSSAGIGSWMSGDPSVATIGSATGIATAMSVGTASITYGYGCNATTILTVNAGILPIVAAGSTSICVGSTLSLSHPTAGGTWSSGNPGVATIGASGVVNGVTGGTCVISYNAPTGCSAAIVVTVNDAPSAIVLPSALICVGQVTTLSNAVTGGTWLSSNTAVATVVAVSGVVTGISNGTTTIDYTIANGCFSSVILTVSPMPIVGPNTVNVGATISLSDATLGGTWSSSTPARATVGAATGIVAGVSAGTAIITYALSPQCRDTILITVKKPTSLDNVSSPVSVKVIPNPNNGAFTLEMMSDYEENVNVVIFNVICQKVKEFTATTNKTTEVELKTGAGIYFVSTSTSRGNYVIKVIVR